MYHSYGEKRHDLKPMIESCQHLVWLKPNFGLIEEIESKERIVEYNKVYISQLEDKINQIKKEYSGFYAVWSRLEATKDNVEMWLTALDTFMDNWRVANWEYIGYPTTHMPSLAFDPLGDAKNYGVYLLTPEDQIVMRHREIVEERYASILPDGVCSKSYRHGITCACAWNMVVDDGYHDDEIRGEVLFNLDFNW